MQAIHPRAVAAPCTVALPPGLPGALLRWLRAVPAGRGPATVRIPPAPSAGALDPKARRDVGLPPSRMSSREQAARLLARSGPLV